MTGSRSQSVRRSLHLSIDPSPYDQKISLSPSDTSPSDASFINIASAGTTPVSAGCEWVIYSVLCLFDFESHDPDHLPFNKNEILNVVKQEESGWWAALRPGGKQVGWIPKAFVQPLTIEMTEKLLTVREELRVFEYEAEQLYNSAPISHLHHLYEFESSPPSSRDTDWSPAAEAPKLSPPTHLSSPRTTPRSAYYGDSDVRDGIKLRPPPSPMTPMPQPPPSKSAPLQVNKPTPPVPFGERYDECVRSNIQRSRSASESIPTNSWNNNRRRPMLADDRGCSAGLSTLMEAGDIPEIDSPVDRSCSVNTNAKTKTTSEKIRQITGSDDALAFHNAKQAMINLPWYLRPNYPPDHIIMDKDFNVRAGTLRALVERLTADYLTNTQESNFRNAFLMTFRTFSTPDKVFELLTDLYRMESPTGVNQMEFRDWREKRLHPTRKRVLTVLTMWLEDHGLLQEEPHIAQRLTDFLTQIVEPSPLALTAKLMLQSLERLTFANPNANVSPSISPRRRRKTKPHRNELLRVDPTDIAEQLCLMEHALYAKVHPQECLRWPKTQTGKSVEALHAFCSTHDKLASWVKMSILESEALGKRSDTVEYWIKVAEKCRNLNNFASMSALINALSSTAITRLHLTWAHVGKKSNLDTLLKHNEPTGGFSGYRNLLQSAEGPCVPFIGMFLTDIVHIQDQFGDNISPTAANPDNSLICFVKRQRWYDVITTMLRHQQKPYNFAECESTRTFIENHVQSANAKDPSWFWSKSQEVQHSELAHADIRRGLVEAGF